MKQSPPRRRLFINARIMDPETGLDIHGDVLAEKGKITAIGKGLSRDEFADGKGIVDCQGAVLAPGLVDARVFIGEPGGEHRETIKTAGRAAAAGGVTTMVMMPDTDPVIDDVSLVDFVRATASAKSPVRILPAAALSKGQNGEMMTEMGLLKDAGAVAFTDGRKTIANSQMMRRALTYSADIGALVMASHRDPHLGSGVMNAGINATRMGLSGIPREAEIIPLERDMRLVAMTGAKYHASCLSTAESVEVLARAKDAGRDVTGGVAVANLCLSELDIGPYRTFFKVSPPLRSVDDRLAMVEGIRSGALDMIVSNHDPQDVDTKRLPFSEAADGAVGLESLLAAALRLHHSDDIPLMRVLKCLSLAPARRLGRKCGRITKGARADFVIFDPDAPWKLDDTKLRSRSRNTPFQDALLQGRVLKTVVAGRTVFSQED
ncbi:dihydroorotase [Ahrensia sp. R2A130]|uniref:dihydroorotase n=1 Tax=Ahrensia sp. R2A130 TaxID=744979 RepID=UPI0001E0D0A6|nr:dihydroorotase [Ahrensia sp. R2A130]EFL90293.1 dihydroorotase [Ahrensia sp. R2A130]